jgi:hypothetical protein
MMTDPEPQPWPLDIGPLAGDELLGALLVAIGACGLGTSTLITNGGRQLAVIIPPPEPAPIDLPPRTPGAV